MAAIPTVPTWQAGQRVLASQLQQLSDACTFTLNPPMLEVTQTAGQSMATGTPTVIQLDNTVVDQYSGWNAATWTYTVVYPGRYRVDLELPWALNGTGVRLVQLLVNGVTSTVAAAQETPTASGVTSCIVSVPILFAVGDTLQMRGNQTSGGALSTQATGGFTPTFGLTFMHA